MANVNKLRDTIITAFQVARTTKNKVPMLLLSNPGFAKTTIVNEIGDKYNYHVESLIGSGFDNNEVLGYQVNEPGKDYLITKNPTWYESIINYKKQGIPSILFIDELSVCPSLTQGALYRLIFERTLGNGKQLPEDTVILSAGNYKDNLPSWCEITSPALNRFCVINLVNDSYEDFLNEFMQNEEERLAQWPNFFSGSTYESILNDTSKEGLQAQLKSFLMDLFCIYKDKKDSSKGCLDMSNKDFSSIFDGSFSETGEVYNFITGRTIEYLKKGMAACVALGVDPQKSEFVFKMMQGLIGAGTCNFNETQQVAAYQNAVYRQVKAIINKLSKGAKGSDDVEIFDDEDALSAKIQKFSAALDGNEASQKALKKAAEKIYECSMKYANSHEVLKDKLGGSVREEDRTLNYALITEDITSIKEFCEIGKEFLDKSKMTELEKIFQLYKFVISYNL